MITMCENKRYGNAAISWGVEQVMDMAAEKLGIDPAELRLKNICSAYVVVLVLSS